jgi:hypothetical protein
VSSRGAFALLVAPGGGRTVVAAPGASVTVESGGASVTLSGPERVALPDGGPPGAPERADPFDDRGWYAMPVMEASVGPAAGGGRELRVVLRPSVPEVVPVAPWEPSDPPFSILAEDAAGRQRTVVLLAKHFLQPPGPGGPGGLFLLSGDRPYILRVDPDALGLPPGRHRVRVAYAARRPNGPWRGTSLTPPLDLEAR